MLKTLEKLFGFRTYENTDVSHYIKRMDEMGRVDDKKQNELIVAMINKIMVLEERIDSLEQTNTIKNDELQALENKIEELKPKEIVQTRIVKKPSPTKKK